MSTTIRVGDAVRDRLAALAARRYGAGISLGDALDRLLADAEREQILTAYAALRSDPAEWADYTAELAEWDAVTGDRPE